MSESGTLFNLFSTHIHEMASNYSSSISHCASIMCASSNYNNTSHATIGLRMDSADDVYIIVWQSGPQETEDQKLYFKRGALPFLSRVSFCSAIVTCFTLFITAVDHGTQYIFDITKVLDSSFSFFFECSQTI